MAHTAADLDASAIRLTDLREDGKAELIEIIEALRGRKYLVLDEQLAQLLPHILVEGVQILKDYGVVHFHPLHPGSVDPILTSRVPEDVAEHVVYLVRPNMDHMHVIADQVRAMADMRLPMKYHVYFVPHKTIVCEQLLQDLGVFQDVLIGECHLGLVTLDVDLLSLEIDEAFKQWYVDGDTSAFISVARALHKMQLLYGIIPNVKAKGAASKRVLEKMMLLRKAESPQAFPPKSDIDTLVVIDREIDLWTPMATPLTYEGLIDEFVGIRAGSVALDTSMLGDETKVEPTGETRAVPLNSSDDLFQEIRDLSIEALGSYLQEKAVAIKKSYATFRDNKDASISEIHEFVKRIPGLTKTYKSLTQHINIAELLKINTDSKKFRDQWQLERAMFEGENVLDAIEEMIYMDVDRKDATKVLRLLCLHSLTTGIRANRYDQFRRLIVQNYGFEYLFTMTNLERAGLLKRRESSWVDTGTIWPGLRRPLRLINESVRSNPPNDIAYVSAGYAPLSVRLVQFVPNPGWGALGDVLKVFPGPILEFNQQLQPEELKDAVKRFSMEAGAHGMHDSLAPALQGTTFEVEGTSKRVMLVLYLGGITYMELAALRYLSRDPSYPFTIIAATTKVINGTTLINSMAYDFGNPQA